MPEQRDEQARPSFTEFRDDWAKRHAEAMKNPEYAKAYREAEERLARSVMVPCHFGYCVHEVDPLTNRIGGGFGPMACPCDHSKGWRSPYVAGQARPHVPVKARGRHGSRRQRARARQQQMPDYGDMLAYLPATSRYPRLRPGKGDAQ